jgi:hypothetical protein
MAAIIDTTTFRLRPGADPSEFLAADAKVQTGFSYQQPGLVRRTTACDAAGEYLVVEMWNTAEAADLQRSAAADSAVIANAMALIDLDSIRVSRYRTLD